MKLLTLVRHAKSSWGSPGLRDFDRPLNDRGRRDAPVMGERLAKAGVQPDLWVASPARRACKTARLVCKAIGHPVDSIELDDRLYEASVPMLLEVIQGLPDVTHAALVAHNPGTTELCNVLADSDIRNIPTCGVARLELFVDTWQDVIPMCATLLDFDYPKREVGRDGES